jgi:hypothetical protein
MLWRCFSWGVADLKAISGGRVSLEAETKIRWQRTALRINLAGVKLRVGGVGTDAVAAGAAAVRAGVGEMGRLGALGWAGVGWLERE